MYLYIDNLRYILQYTVLNLVVNRHDRQLESLAFLQLQCEVLHWRYIMKTCLMHIPFSTRLNGSYQYYYQYCKLITRIQADSTDTLLQHFWVSSTSFTESLRSKIKIIKNLIVNIFNIDIFIYIYMKCNKIKSSVYLSVINSNLI